MIHAIRAFVKSWFATGLLTILILAFAVTGIYQRNSGGAGTPAVVQAGSHRISDEFYKRQFERNMQEAAQRSGGQMPPLRDAIQAGLDNRVLQDLKGQAAIAEMLQRIGIRPSNRLVVQAMRQDSSLFNPVTGEFDRRLYTQFLQRVHATPQEFEGFLRDEVAQQHFVSALTAGLQSPRVYVVMDAALQAERRDASYIAIPGQAIDIPPPPNDAALTAFVASHSEGFQVPELRTITLVRFSAVQLAPTMPVDEAAVQREFAFRQETLSTPEKRSFVQVPIRQASQAAAVAAALRAGQDPAAVARTVGTEVITYDDKPQSAIADHRIAQAAFAMHAGDVSGPVQGDVGLAVLRMTTVTPGHVAQLADVRQEIENQLKARAAEQRANQLSEAYDDARNGGANLVVAAQRAGAPTITVGPIQEDGRDMHGQINPVLTQQIVQTAFHDLSQNQESDIIEVSRGESYAVRVERVYPRSTAQLADFRDLITRRYMQMRIQEIVEALLNRIEARLRGGESMEAVAASVHGEVGHVAGQTRQPNPAEPLLRPSFIQGLFGGRLNETFKGEINGGVAVGRITGIHPGEPAMIAAVVQQTRDRATQELFGGLGNGIGEFAVAMVRPTTNLNQARRVLGVDPTMVPGATNATNSAPARTAQ